MANALIVTSDEAPDALDLVGEKLTVLASGAQTGSYEIFHQAGPEGAGPPPHSHGWDEAFYVLGGELIFGIGDGPEVSAQAGTLVHIPTDTIHWFRFGAGGGSMVSVTSREGASHFFEEAAAKISPTAPDLGQLVAIATSHGLTVPVPT